jgi:hypothetical protein
MKPHLTFAVACSFVAGCSLGPTRLEGIPGADAGPATSTGSDAASPAGPGAPIALDAAGVGDAGGADRALPSANRDARVVFDAAPAPDRPTFEVPVDRPPLPDGQFYYPSLDGKLCGSDEYQLPKFTAEVLVLLDRSGSMAGMLGNSTKWDDAAAVVKATVTNSSNVSWGLKLFPTGSQACGASATVEVPLAPGSAAAIGIAVDGAGPPMGTLGEGTPITATMKAATTHLQSLTPTGPKHIVLVTDGAPSCLNGNPNSRDEAQAIAAIQSAAKAGFKTLVIGIATAAADVATLDKMAVAGGAPRAGTPRYYPAGSQAELSAVLDGIVASLTPCVFPLANRPLDPNYVTVTVGNAPLIRDLSHQQGWDYVNNGAAIQIYGNSCEDLKKGAAQGAGIFYGCPY